MAIQGVMLICLYIVTTINEKIGPVESKNIEKKNKNLIQNGNSNVDVIFNVIININMNYNQC